ncbi:MAG: hypothetical protein WCT19_04000 [Candidatus Paceibacterota bacterium]
MKKGIPYSVSMGMLIGAGIVVILATALSGKPSGERASDHQKIVAKTWGWAKLVSEPVSVTSPDAPHGHDNISLMQVEFQMSDIETLTAFVNAGATAGMASPLPSIGNHWKNGDEVLIVSVPAKSGGDGVILGGVPSRVYFVIDYRSKQ